MLCVEVVELLYCVVCYMHLFYVRSQCVEFMLLLRCLIALIVAGQVVFPVVAVIVIGIAVHLALLSRGCFHRLQ